MQKTIIITGLALVVIGLLYPYLDRIPLGRLPGDINYKSDRFSFVFPVVTCIVISIVVTVIMKLFR